MPIKQIHSAEEIRAAYETYRHLRPHLNEDDFVAQVLRQMTIGFQVFVIEEAGRVMSVIGFRMQEHLAWGKIIYIDDLISHPDARGKGYASQLLEHVEAIAIENQCKALHLDSGYQRNAAHRLYVNHGYILDCHHFALRLE